MRKHVQITINREFGSGGRLIGEALSKKLNVKLVDKQILEEAAKAMKMSPQYLEQFDEKAPSIWDSFQYSNSIFHGMSIPMYYNKITNNELYIMEAEFIKKLAEKEKCIFVGRCASYILKDEPHISIFLYADMNTRIHNLTEVYGFKKDKDIEKQIKKADKQRADYYRLYTSKDWKEMSQYDLCIDTSKMTLDKVVDTIYYYIQKRKWSLEELNE